MFPHLVELSVGKRCVGLEYQKISEEFFSWTNFSWDGGGDASDGNASICWNSAKGMVLKE